MFNTKRKGMVQINITEFEGYDEAAFLNFLELEEGEQLKLSVPKRTALYQSTHLEMATEYSHMLLLGQKLYAMAEDFCYELPRLDEKGHFVFYVLPKDKESLASLLEQLVLMQDYCSDALIDFDVEASEFLGQFGIVDFACYDFFVLASNFLLIEDSESDL